MKTLFNRLMIVSLVLGILSVGVGIGHEYQRRFGSDLNGTPKAEFPPVGSVVRIEAVFDDGTFVGTYAGDRRYYKAPLRRAKVAIVLEPNKAYEVIEQKIEMGGKQIALIPIN